MNILREEKVKSGSKSPAMLRIRYILSIESIHTIEEMTNIIVLY
jgi:hypothetical protein